MGGLPDYDGKAVVATAAQITRTGDGLSKAMNLEPEFYSPGSDAVILLRGKWSRHIHDYDEDTGCYTLKQTVRASTIVILPAEAVPGVEHYLDEMDAKIATKANIAEGVHKLPTPEALTEEHQAGGHANGVVPACPLCRDEMDAAEREATVSPIPKAKAAKQS